MPPGITIVGLGPGNPELLTRQAWDHLAQAGEVYARTRQHPTLAGLPRQVEIHSFDDLYDQSERFEEVYQKIVERVLELGRRTQGVTYAVPGHPFIAEATAPQIVRQARDVGIPVRIIEGLSFIEPVCTALGIDPFPYCSLVDAIEIGQSHVPPFPPDRPALIAQIYSRQTASDLKLSLMSVYPDDYRVRLVHAAGTPDEKVEELPLYKIDRSASIGLLTALYVPPLPAGSSFEAFQEIIAHLRAPDGCPWDQQQTHLSLRKHLLEESYEALTALDAEDPAALAEELGDLLLQIVLHAQIASEDGEFDINQVLRGIYNKIVRRHPHVFGEVSIRDVGGVLLNWEKLKAAERAEIGQMEERGMLDGVPQALPALSQSQEIQDRAARVGFDWADIEPVWAKVMEELEEVRQAPNKESRAGELGDLLFAVVNLARWFKVDAESVLRETNLRFRKRFHHIEVEARRRGRELGNMSLAEMDEIWEAAKGLENPPEG